MIEICWISAIVTILNLKKANTPFIESQIIYHELFFAVAIFFFSYNS